MRIKEARSYPKKKWLQPQQTVFDWRGNVIRNMRGGNMPKAQVKKAVDIPTGEYFGRIVKNEVAEFKDQYEYHRTTIAVEMEKDSPEVILGVPFGISEKTVLGQMLKRFGADLKTGEEVDTDEYLKVGARVKFSILRAKGKTEATKDMFFSNIQAETLEPAEEDKK